MRPSWYENAAVGSVVAACAAAAGFACDRLVAVFGAPLPGSFRTLLWLAGTVALYIGLMAAVVRLTLRFFPLCPGEYRHDEPMALRWRFVTSLTEMGGMYFLPWVPVFVRPLLYRLFGARVGRSAQIAGKLIELPFIEVGEEAFIGGSADVTAHLVTPEMLLIEPVRIGAMATIGIKATVLPGCRIGEGAVIAPGAVLTRGTHVPPGEFWAGVPARRVGGIPGGT